MRRSFTLLELVLATALCLTLMMGVLAVLSSVRGLNSPAHGHTDAWRSVASELVDRDLRHAIQLRTETGALYIRGLCALDRDAGSPIHRPVEVSYRIQETGGRR